MTVKAQGNVFLLRLSVSLIFCCTSQGSWANQPVPAVHVSCMPELSHMRISQESFDDSTSFQEDLWSNSKMGHRAWDQMRKYGYYDAHSFSVECKLAGATYRVTGNTNRPSATGYCSGAPQTMVTVLKNNEKIIDDVAFSECSGSEAHIGQIDIYGGQRKLSDPFIGTSIITRRGTVEIYGAARVVNAAYLVCVASDERVGSKRSNSDVRRSCEQKLGAGVQQREFVPLSDSEIRKNLIGQRIVLDRDVDWDPNSHSIWFAEFFVANGNWVISESIRAVSVSHGVWRIRDGQICTRVTARGFIFKARPEQEVCRRVWREKSFGKIAMNSASNIPTDILILSASPIKGPLPGCPLAPSANRLGADPKSAGHRDYC